MWTKIKGAILHRVVQKAAVAATAALTVYLSKPEVIAALAKFGFTSNPKATSAAIVGAGTFLLALIYHWVEHRMKSNPGPISASGPVSK